MDLEKNKKVRLVVGMEQDLDDRYVKKIEHFFPEEIIILKSNELTRIEPFGDLMRNILIHVYQKNIEEVFIAEPKEDRENSKDLLDKLEKNKQLNKNIRTLDYLFTNCDPEFPNITIKEWFEGTHLKVDNLKHSFDVIHRHPLMPPSVKVTVLQ